MKRTRDFALTREESDMTLAELPDDLIVMVALQDLTDGLPALYLTCKAFHRALRHAAPVLWQRYFNEVFCARRYGYWEYAPAPGETWFDLVRVARCLVPHPFILMLVSGQVKRLEVSTLYQHDSNIVGLSVKDLDKVQHYLLAQGEGLYRTSNFSYVSLFESEVDIPCYELEASFKQQFLGLF